MAVRVKPVNNTGHGNDNGPAADGAENAVHFYRPAVDTRPRPAGSFLGAFVRHSDVPAFYCQSADADDYDDFVSRVAKADKSARPCHFVRPGDPRGFAEAPVLRAADLVPGPLMWRRRTMGQRRYSIAAEISEIGSAAIQAGLIDLAVAPAQPWDALVFPSKTVKAAAERLMARHADYLKLRLGVETVPGAQAYVIPPGINAAAYADTAETRGLRDGVRRRLGIRDDDFCVLVTGNFQFYRRQHPTPLFLSLEAAARRSGARIHLLQAGWFDNERIERAYRDAVQSLAPAVNAIFLDGREADVRDRVWFAADAYAAFHDAPGAGVDTEVLEAMAAGLPVVAADWAGNRDLIRNGETGYLAPTWLALPESGGDLSLAPENALTGADPARADTFLSGTLEQTAAVDVRAAAEAFEALAGDVDHRLSLGAAARRWAAETVDWPVVIRRHQALWAELGRIRAAAAEIAPEAPGTAAVPHLDDPFAVFGPFATHAIAERTRVEPASGLRRGEGIGPRLAVLRGHAINDVARDALLTPDEQMHVLEHLPDDGAEIIQLAQLLAENRRYRLPRTLGWLAKMGVVRLSPPPADAAAADAEATGVSLIELGLAARRQGADAHAAEYFRSVLQQNPDDPVANLNLGEVFAASDRLDAAVPHFERVVAANPTAVDARLDLGKALFLQGRHEAGIAELQDACDLAPENAEAWYLLGAAYRRAGAADEAIAALERSLRLRSNRAEALVHLGYARKSAGRRAEAVQAFRDAAKAAPGNLFARAGELSLGAERDGRRLMERDAAARRVALHFNGAAQFRPLADLFVRLQGRHWPLLSADGVDLAEFKPDVVVVAGTQTAEVRRHAANAVIVAVPAFLASLNRFRAAFDGADAVCAPGPVVADAWARLGLAAAERIHPLGHLPLDPLFRGDPLPAPAALAGSGPVVLYAPGARPGLSSAPAMLDDTVYRLRGGRDDITVVIKPHPESFQRQPRWIEAWRDEVREQPRAVLVDERDAATLPYLAAADVLVTDVSSVMFDFLAVDRPVLLLDNPASGADAAHDPQGIEWRWREIGRRVADADDLARAVDQALKAPAAGGEIRARYRQALFGDTMDGRTAERIVDLIGELST